MRPIPRFAAVLVLLAACGDGPLDPGRFALDGRWEGRGFPYELELELRQDRDNRVSGTGTLYGLREVLTLDTLELEPLRVDTTSADTVRTGSVGLRVRGEWDFPAFRLELVEEGFAGAVYEARYVQRRDTVARVDLVRADSLEGRLEGPGFGAVALPLARVP